MPRNRIVQYNAAIENEKNPKTYTQKWININGILTEPNNKVKPGKVTKWQLSNQKMLSKDRLKQTSEEKLTMLEGRSFHTFITRCVKKEDLTLLVHCDLNSL